MLAPTLTANQKPSVRNLPVMQMVQSSVWARNVARYLLYVMLLSIAALLLLPWQQTSRASGRVVAFVPQQRQQTVTSQVEGVVGRIQPELREGSVVKAGDFIMTIEPLAAGLLDQLTAQRTQLNEKLNFAEQSAKVYGDQKKAFEEARDYAVEAADQLVIAAKQKYEGKLQEVESYRAKEKAAKLDFDRQSQMVVDGIRAPRDFEKVRMEFESATAMLNAALKQADAAQSEVTAKEKEREQKRLEAQTKVESAEATIQKSLSDVAVARKEISELDVKIQELSRLDIRAPQDGTIFRLPVFEQGQQISKGSELFTIVPDTSEPAVELLMPGNDLPLIGLDAEVRLQFEGWPAVQFVGWPSIAIGSFGGRVAAIDATDDGTGQFRVLVRPTEEEPWPARQYLRQGVRANGWVMLGKVPLWFELWRQLNGFPPAASEAPDKKEDKPVKVPKPKV